MVTKKASTQLMSFSAVSKQKSW